MKTRGDDSLLSQQPGAKRSRLELPSNAFEGLPAEIWHEISSHLDKRALRVFANICNDFYQIAHCQLALCHASWPATDYRLYRPNKFSHFDFEARSGQWWETYERNIHLLVNGDVALGLDDGRLVVLPLRSNVWKVYGIHQREEYDELINLPVGGVIALKSGELASICDDGVWIWDRSAGTEKYHIILPSRYSEVFNFYMKLIELPNGNLLAGCSDGSVHVLKRVRMEHGHQYQYGFSMPLGDLFGFHLLKNLVVVNGEIIAEYNDCIYRWTFNGELIEKIDIAEIKKSLSPVYNRDLTQASLKFKWDYPDGYVAVTTHKVTCLINLFNRQINPCMLGKVVSLSCMASGDIVVVSEQDHHFYQVRTGWNPTTNVFTIVRNNAFMSDVYIYFLPDARILSYSASDYTRLTIFDAHRDQRQLLLLRHPRRTRVPGIKHVLKNGDLLTYDSFGLYIFDLETGHCKVRINNKSFWEVAELPNGDLLTQRRTLSFFNRYPLMPGIDVDHVEVFRFGLKK